MRRCVVLTISSLMLVVLPVIGHKIAAADPLIKSSVDATALPKKKKTSLGLYITAKEATGLLKNQDDVVLIDVRTPEETMFIGYPEISAANIPFKHIDPKHRFNRKKGSYELVPNQDFVGDFRTFLKTATGNKTKTIVLMCRSGTRSAAAVDSLAKAGFTNVYSMVDGFEGDKGKDGRRTVNGWQNSGAPWTTKVRQGYLLRNGG